MTKPRKKRPPKAGDPQGKRFVALGRKLEADGELNATDAEATFERAFKKVVPPKGTNSSPDGKH